MLTLDQNFSNIIITPIRHKDIDPLSKLYSQAFSNIESDPRRLIKYFIDLQSLIGMKNGLSMMLIQKPDEPEITPLVPIEDYLGYGSIYQNLDSDTGDEYVHIPEVFVNPKYQGFGLGKRLMDLLLQAASNKYQNSEWIDLNVLPFNTTAIHLYDTKGFEQMFDFTKNGCQFIRMAKPLHNDFALHIYPMFNPNIDKNPGIPEYFTESAAYPVLRFTKYTKKLYGEMIRFQYGVYEDDAALSKKEVNAHAKQDASALLGAIDRDPQNFIVYCAVTEVSIAGYIIMMKDANKNWTFIMDHYYDTDKEDLAKLVEYAVKECKLKVDPKVAFETMISRDALRGKSKTKYRSMYTVQDYQKPEPEINPETGEEEPETKYSTIQTPLPSSKPQEPELKGTEFDTTVAAKNEPEPVVSKPDLPTPRFTTVATRVPSSTPLEPPSKTKIFIKPKPIMVDNGPDIVVTQDEIPSEFQDKSTSSSKTTTPERTAVAKNAEPDEVEPPMDVANAPQTKGIASNEEAPEVPEEDIGVPPDIVQIANNAARDFEDNAPEEQEPVKPVPMTQFQRQQQNRDQSNRNDANSDSVNPIQIIDEPDDEEDENEIDFGI